MDEVRTLPQQRTAYVTSAETRSNTSVQPAWACDIHAPFSGVACRIGLKDRRLIQMNDKSDGYSQAFSHHKLHCGVLTLRPVGNETEVWHGM